jgi:hypothetical protein
LREKSVTDTNEQKTYPLTDGEKSFFDYVCEAVFTDALVGLAGQSSIALTRMFLDGNPVAVIVQKQESAEGQGVVVLGVITPGETDLNLTTHADGGVKPERKEKKVGELRKNTARALGTERFMQDAPTVS